MCAHMTVALLPPKLLLCAPHRCQARDVALDKLGKQLDATRREEFDASVQVRGMLLSRVLRGAAWNNGYSHESSSLWDP